MKVLLLLVFLLFSCDSGKDCWDDGSVDQGWDACKEAKICDANYNCQYFDNHPQCFCTLYAKYYCGGVWDYEAYCNEYGYECVGC